MSSQTIVINGRFLTRPISGVERYAIELIAQIDQLIGSAEFRETGLNVEILMPHTMQSLPSFKNISIRKIGFLRGHLWEQVELPFYTRKNLLFCPCNSAPIAKRRKVVTVHDASVCSVPDSYSFAFRLWYRILIPLIGKTATRIITVSEFAKKDICYHFKIKPSKVDVIYHGADHIDRGVIDEDFMKTHGLKKQSYVLSIGTFTKNRNFNTVEEALQISRHPETLYVIAGETKPKIFNKSRVLRNKNTLILGHIDLNKLKTLYTYAICTIVPSFYDSFGFPAVESIRCGTPVIASGSAALPEICNSAALYIDPARKKDISEKINIMLEDKEVRKKMVSEAGNLAKQYTWEKTARITLQKLQGL